MRPPYPRHADESAIGSFEYTVKLRERDGFNLGTVARRSPKAYRRRCRTWTHTRSLVDRGAHAVEFSKTAASPKRFFLSGDASGFPVKGPPGQDR
jgi:hypothetical protein